MPAQRQSIRLLAAAFAAGRVDDAGELVDRTKPLVGDLRRAKWLRPLAESIALAFAGKPRPTTRALADLIRKDRGFTKAWELGKIQISYALTEPQMAPMSGAPETWTIPQLTTLDDLATTLRLHPDDLGWLTSPGQAEHYLYQWRAKRKSGDWRLLEIPKPLLKEAQTQVLRRILDSIPVHESARGFRRGSSVRDFVEPHTNQQLLIRLDLADFFPSIGGARVLKLFLTAGYPETVARSLTRLCVNSAPTKLIQEKPLSHAARNRLTHSHLPQGAPTSPALANLCAFRLDCRLSRLAKSTGAHYTRYADDLLFSADHLSKRFAAHVGAIVLEEGFRLNDRKTRFLSRSQRQAAAGIVINERPNLKRADFDRMKAILTNCARHGPETQNRDDHPDLRAHLLGKIAWVEFLNPNRGQQLRKLFERIRWKM